MRWDEINNLLVFKELLNLNYFYIASKAIFDDKVLF